MAAAFLCRVRRSSLHSAFPVSVSAGKAPHPLPPSSFPNRTRFAGLRFGGDGGLRKLALSVLVFPQEGEQSAVLLQGCKQRYAPSGSHARKLPGFSGLSDMRGNTRRECFCLLLYLSDGSDQFPPNIQYFTGSTPDCQSFFRHLRRFFPRNFVKFSRKSFGQ